MFLDLKKETNTVCNWFVIRPLRQRQVRGDLLLRVWGSLEICRRLAKLFQSLWQVFAFSYLQSADKKCLQSAGFVKEEMTDMRCFLRRDKSGTINQSELQEALTTFGYNLSPEVHKQSQQFTWKSLLLCVLQGVFRCFIRCTVSCYASLTEPVDTLCASTTSSSVVLSCRSLSLWQSMEGCDLCSDYLQIFARLVQMNKCRYFYVWYERLFANICTSVSGDHRHVPERRPWYVRPDYRRLRDLPRHASQLAPALSKHQKTVTIAKSFLDIPFSYLTAPNLNVWDKRTLIESSW